MTQIFKICGKDKINLRHYKKDMTLVAIVSLSLPHNLSLSAQDGKTANKLVYTELGGPGVIMSANFDSRFLSSSQVGFGFRLGAGFGYGKYIEYDVYPEYTVSRSESRSYYSIPAGLNYIFGKPNFAHSFEVGAGVTFLTRKVSLFYYSKNVKPGNVIGFFTFMYRMIPKDGGFSWRAGLTPIIGTSGDLYPMGAVGFGYVF